jgi:hypothetical protein
VSGHFISFIHFLVCEDLCGFSVFVCMCVGPVVALCSFFLKDSCLVSQE